MFRLAAILFLLSGIPIAAAQRGQCSAVEEQRAEMQADTLRTWDTLYKSYKLYGKCDDGAIAEGYSESVARILVDHWNTLPRVANLVAKDARFRRFVLGHVDSTLDLNDLKKIRANAKRQWPSGLSAICAELTKETDAALKEDASSGTQ
ncbi:MAG: hypothetical protein WAN23_13795 [Candidatus Acidiferrales bacterium]